MFAQKQVLNAFFCVAFVLLAGCKKEATNSGGVGGTSTPSNNESTADAAALEKAKKQSIDNLKNLGKAIHAYHDNMGTLPGAGLTLDKKSSPNPQGAAFNALSWRVKLLPYVEHDPLYAQISVKLTENPFAPVPDSVAKQSIPIYANPLKPNGPQTNYRVFVGPNTIFDPYANVKLIGVTDGTSNTILIVEAAEAVDWSTPGDLAFDPNKPLPKLGIFPGGFHALMADGAVRWIPSNTPEAVIKKMIIRNDGEAINLPGKQVFPIDEEPSTGQPPFTKIETKAEPVPQDNQPKKGGDEIEKIREAAAKQKSKNNLKQIGIALFNHESAHAKFPSPGVPKGVNPDKNLSSPHSWRVAILPFIEQVNLWKLIPNNGQGAIPKEVSEAVVKLYLSPLAKDAKPQTHYRVFVGNGAAFEWGKALKVADFTDGLSNTIIAVECADPIDWSSIDDFNYDPKKPLPKLGGIFPGGFHALMGDANVIWIPDTTPEATIRALITRAGGETVTLPDSKPKK